ncbi:MAG: ATP-binding protein [Candidatus Sericytochromatia bacterium]|nr:ATP-binding protein [Candidatus Tanganyikabacteria bacterium]
MVDVLERPRYWPKIDPWVGAPLIKVLAGQWRVGKSCLLKALRQRLMARPEAPPVLFVEMERAEWAHLNDAAALLRWVAEAAPGGPAVVMIDEVQEIREFDVALRSLLAEGRFDLYVTGSNAELLSGEIASRFAGRSVELPVFPLCYDEFLTFHDRPDDEESLRLFLRFGGLPFLRHLPLEDEVAFEYLLGVAQTAIFKDVVTRHAIRNPDLLERLVLFLADNVGSPVSAQSIARFLKSQRTAASVPTLLSYVGYLEKAYLVRRVRRADLEGKRFFEVAEKHYFEDLGVRAALLGSRERDVSKIVENVVLGRLLADGWSVTTGDVGGREIDFVCRRGREKLYVQACYLLADAATREREFRTMLAIDDNYPKVIVSLDPLLDDHRGVAHRHLRDFLRDGWGSSRCP